MIEYRQFTKVVIVHLLVCEVVGRTPATPLARHRDVMTTQGTARGYYAPRPPHYAFLGLPYARPPTRHDRFKAPRPYASWSGTFEGIHRVKCPQPDGSGDENCLVVNVFAPEHATSQPVIVYFHGGRFQSGWGSFKAPVKLLERNFVYVTFNYRLGVLGFLCLLSETVPGNAGLKDQVAALYWVQRNIAKFGGNPSDVTVYGTGSGASAIEMLLLSGLNEDLFQKVILESGSALTPSALSHEPVSDAIDFAEQLGITTTDPKALSDFYRDLPFKELVNTSKIFLPCVEAHVYHSLLDKEPREILRSKYKQVPMMIVYTNAKEVALITDDMDRFSTIPDKFDDLLPDNLAFNNDEIKSKIAKHVKDFYFEDIELRENVIRSYIDYINDIFIEYPIVKSAANHARRGNPVFLMKFSYKGQLSNNKNDNIPGASFGDILQYISADEYLEDYDEIVTDRLVTLWTNFITLGDPTPLTTPLIPDIWQPVTTILVEGEIILKKISCLMFRKNMRNEELSGQQFTFWDRIYDKFYIKLSDK